MCAILSIKNGTKNYKNEKILNPFISDINILIINKIMSEIKFIRNVFIKHLVHSKNTHYLCAH